MGFLDNKIDLPEGENLAPDPERVAAIRDLLDPDFRHLGQPGSNRAAWSALQSDPVGRRIQAETQRALSLDPRPMVTDELYRYCLENEGQAELRAIALPQRTRMGLLPIALCLDPHLEGLDVLRQDLNDLLALRSWVSPANDDQGLVYAGKVMFNDLSSLHNASHAVAARYLVGDRLGPELCRRVKEETTRRVLDPFRERIESGQDVYWWIRHDNNWNSVCLALTLSCALALCDDLDERAWYVAVVEEQIRNSMRGIAESGFYLEGTNYWAYGFGHYVLAAEMVRAATRGKLDWLKDDKAQRTAGYGSRMEIQDRVFPSFADCRSDVPGELWLQNWLNNRIDASRSERSTDVRIEALDGFRFQFPLALLLVCFVQEHPAYLGDVGVAGRLREWFEDVAFLICRPRPDNPVRLAATLKGGHNGVSHNHNDLGTFTVQVDDQTLLVDPGAELYTGRTFGPERYVSGLLNSYGHPVPVVAGQLQGPDHLEFGPGFGTDFKASVIRAEFSETMDRVVLDLSGAYPVESLVRLERDFVYDRTGDGRIEVTDRVAFDRPESFETALISYADWQRLADGSIVVTASGRSLCLKVSSDTGDLEFSDTIIRESSTPVRLSWGTAEPVLQAVVRCCIRPVSTAAGGGE